jgi:hypothetical protein
LLVACWKRPLKESATACAPGMPALDFRQAGPLVRARSHDWQTRSGSLA